MLPDIGIDLYPILLVIGVILSCVILEFYFKKIGMKKGVSTNIELAVTISAIAGIIYFVHEYCGGWINLLRALLENME